MLDFGCCIYRIFILAHASPGVSECEKEEPKAPINLKGDFISDLQGIYLNRSKPPKGETKD